MVDEIKKDIRTIRESQIRMEGDLKYHIKRTDVLEAKVIGQEDLLKPLMVWQWFKVNYRPIVFLITLMGATIYFLVTSKIGK